MKLSTDRILTTHVGSLPRPDGLLDLLHAEDRGEAFDAAALARAVGDAVKEVVKRQVDIGIDVVSDGEFGKHSYTHYIKHRVSGIANVPPGAPGARHMVTLDDREFPDWASDRNARPAGARVMQPACCTGAVAYRDSGPLTRDVANFRAAVAAAQPIEGFLNAASPGVLINFIPDRHYGNEEAYLADLTDAMTTEYEAIARSGFILQIDAPDVAMTRNSLHHDKTDGEFLKIAARNIEALNHATRNIPPQQMRFHLCWGNYAGPHKNDIEIDKILPIVLKTRAQAISFEGANPRHEHEWEDWKSIAIPDDKVLIPGVIDSASNFVEHPRLIAQRIRNYADIVGRERVIAGADCGFGTFGKSSSVYESVVWAKLAALVEGARIASHTLWHR